MPMIFKKTFTMCPDCGAQPGEKCVQYDDDKREIRVMWVHPAREKGERRALIGKKVKVTGKIPDDPDPLKIGDTGNIRAVDDGGTLHVNWLSGRSLGLLPGDPYEIIECCDEGAPHTYTELANNLRASREVEHWFTFEGKTYHDKYACCYEFMPHKRMEPKWDVEESHWIKGVTKAVRIGAY
jgi:hypothetical protein